MKLISSHRSSRQPKTWLAISTLMSVLLVGLLVGQPVQALGLGDIELNSALNQPFDGKIPLDVESAAEIKDLEVKLASVEDFRRVNLVRPDFLSSFRFRVVPNEGKPYIQVSSTRSIPEPFVTFLVSVEWSRGRLLREYTVLLDPPLYVLPEREAAPAQVSLPDTTTETIDAGRIERELAEEFESIAAQEPEWEAPAPSAEAAAPSDVIQSDATSETIESGAFDEVEVIEDIVDETIEAIPSLEEEFAEEEAEISDAETISEDQVDGIILDEVIRATPIEDVLGSETVAEAPITTSEPVVALEGDYVVQANDTLWEIALQSKTNDVSVQQMMLAIYEANPSAFSNNINRLKKGATLRLPDYSEVISRSNAEAIASVRTQNAAWQERRTGRIEREPVADTTQRLELVAPENDTEIGVSTSSDELLSGQAAEVVDALAGARRARNELLEVQPESDNRKRLLQVKDDQIAALQAQLAALQAEGVDVDTSALDFADVSLESLQSEDLLDLEFSDETADELADLELNTSEELTSLLEDTSESESLNEPRQASEFAEGIREFSSIFAAPTSEDAALGAQFEAVEAPADITPDAEVAEPTLSAEDAAIAEMLEEILDAEPGIDPLAESDASTLDSLLDESLLEDDGLAELVDDPMLEEMDMTEGAEEVLSAPEMPDLESLDGDMSADAGQDEQSNVSDFMPPVEPTNVEQAPIESSILDEASSEGLVDKIMSAIKSFWWALAIFVGLIVAALLGQRLIQRRRLFAEEEALADMEAHSQMIKVDDEFGSGIMVEEDPDADPTIIMSQPMIEDMASTQTQKLDSVAIEPDETGEIEFFEDTGTFKPVSTAVLEEVAPVDDEESSPAAAEDTEAHDSVALDQADPIAEADFHMAYGLYDQAEEQLKKALVDQPEHMPFHEKLLEVYFVSGNKDAFQQSATAYYNQHGASGEWDKISIMGKQLCPEEALFNEQGAPVSQDALDLDLEATGSFQAPSNNPDFDIGAQTEVHTDDGGVIDIGEDSGNHNALDLGDAIDESRGLDLEFEDESAGADDISSFMPDVDDDSITSTQRIDSVVPPDATAEFPSASENDGTDVFGDFDFKNDDTNLNEAIANLPDDDPSVLLDANEIAAHVSTAEFPIGIDDFSPTAEQPGLGEGLTAEMDATAEQEELQTAFEESSSYDPTQEMDMLNVGGGDHTVELATPLDGGTETLRISSDDLDLPMSASSGDGSPSEINTKLDLARAYIDMGDSEGARDLLNEIVSEGTSEQQQRAQELLSGLS